MDAIPFLLMRLYRFLNNIPFVKRKKKEKRPSRIGYELALLGETLRSNIPCADFPLVTNHLLTRF
jgi:hypothetical protein